MGIGNRHEFFVVSLKFLLTARQSCGKIRPQLREFLPRKKSPVRWIESVWRPGRGHTEEFWGDMEIL